MQMHTRIDLAMQYSNMLVHTLERGPTVLAIEVQYLHWHTDWSLCQFFTYKMYIL